MTRGIPAVDHFIPDVSSDDFEHLLKAKDGGRVTPDMIAAPIETTVGTLLQSDTPTQIVQEDLPTMD